MKEQGSSTTLIDDDINAYDDGDDVEAQKPKFASEEFIDCISSEENEIINELSENNHDSKDPPQDVNIEDREQPADWIYAFNVIPEKNSLKIEEFGQIYIYKKVIDPDGAPTNRFNGFYKNIYTNLPWVDLPGVLSNRYVATSLHKFVNSVLVSQIDLTSVPLTNREPWKSAWLGISKLAINYIKVPNMALYVFQNISDRDVTITSISSELGFSVTNTYDGSNKLKVTPIVRTIGYNGISPMTSFVDYFTFCNFTHDISHTNDASGFTADLVTIQENVGDHLVVLKQYTDIGSVIEDISKSFKKPGREKFKLVCSSAQTKDLFHVLISASIALGKHYSISEHLSVRSKIRKLFERIF